MDNSDLNVLHMALAKPRRTQTKEKDGAWEISKDGKGRLDRWREERDGGMRASRVRHIYV